MGNIEEQINIQEPIVQVLFNSGGAIFDATTAATKKQVWWSLCTTFTES